MATHVLRSFVHPFRSLVPGTELVQQIVVEQFVVETADKSMECRPAYNADPVQ